jgi:predicted MPP superfamily phosphohydrolase
VRYVISLLNNNKPAGLPGPAIARSEFLSQAALIAATIPFGAFTYGIISGAHDYRIRRQTVSLPNLPKAFDGISIGQLSDIHSGSFFNKTAVKGGVEMLLKEKPDVVFFTGDLVNNQTSELKDYFDVFNKVKAPMGVFSVTGNHDYGDYHKWESADAKVQNFQDLLRAHKELGFDLLQNEHRWLEVDGERIAILGNENWGAGRFAKYGKLDQAYEGTEEAPVKLLLSHDPSHWDAQVRQNYKDIDMMFAGHTHGFQFGVEVGGFKWSPSQYIYKQWAGLYKEDNQYLYVNRGFGYLGYPGRVGIPPEITIVTLKRA